MSRLVWERELGDVPRVPKCLVWQGLLEEVRQLVNPKMVEGLLPVWLFGFSQFRVV